MARPKKITMEERFKNLGNKTRSAIVKLLMDNKKGLFVGDIKKQIGMKKSEPSLLSHHLSILKSMEILTVEREAKNKRYSINWAADFIRGRTIKFGDLRVIF